MTRENEPEYTNPHADHPPLTRRQLIHLCASAGVLGLAALLNQLRCEYSDYPGGCGPGRRVVEDWLGNELEEDHRALTSSTGCGMAEASRRATRTFLQFLSERRG